MHIVHTPTIDMTDDEVSITARGVTARVTGAENVAAFKRLLAAEALRMVAQVPYLVENEAMRAQIDADMAGQLGVASAARRYGLG